MKRKAPPGLAPAERVDPPRPHAPGTGEFLRRYGSRRAYLTWAGLFTVAAEALERADAAGRRGDVLSRVRAAAVFTAAERGMEDVVWEAWGALPRRMRRRTGRRPVAVREG